MTSFPPSCSGPSQSAYVSGGKCSVLILGLLTWDQRNKESQATEQERMKHDRVKYS